MTSARLQRGSGNPAGAPSSAILPPIKAPAGMALVIPSVDQELISYLRNVFPMTLSGKHELRDYDRMLGAHQVIEHLAGLFQQQNS